MVSSPKSCSSVNLPPRFPAPLQRSSSAPPSSFPWPSSPNRASLVSTLARQCSEVAAGELAEFVARGRVAVVHMTGSPPEGHAVEAARAASWARAREAASFVLQAPDSYGICSDGLDAEAAAMQPHEAPFLVRLLSLRRMQSRALSAKRLAATVRREAQVLARMALHGWRGQASFGRGASLREDTREHLGGRRLLQLLFAWRAVTEQVFQKKVSQARLQTELRFLGQLAAMASALASVRAMGRARAAFGAWASISRQSRRENVRNQLALLREEFEALRSCDLSPDLAELQHPGPDWHEERCGPAFLTPRLERPRFYSPVASPGWAAGLYVPGDARNPSLHSIQLWQFGSMMAEVNSPNVYSS
ncbi:unnamed protein product [Polarella glacialis]|uniref:Uncharacterized protein n=1 Tax=Polarella glacialis TaxID=89957 RepID=A0A813JTY5_POLGL|nr:unnamed protein product [Polarella glacialis]